MLNAKFINRNGLGKDALSLSVASAKSVIPFFDFEICGRSRSVKVMTGLLQDRRRRSKSSLGSTEHPAKYMLKHLTMNELRFNQTSGGAKPVKVCQSMKGQGARGLARSRTLRAIRRADSDAAAFLPLTHPGTSFIRCQKIKVDQGCSRWLKVNQGILKHFFYGKKSEECMDLAGFHCKAGTPSARANQSNWGSSGSGASGQSRPIDKRNYFITNDLRNNRGIGGLILSKSVKVSQSDIEAGKTGSVTGSASDQRRLNFSPKTSDVLRDVGRNLP